MEPNLVAGGIYPRHIVQQAQRRAHDRRISVTQHSPEMFAHVRHRLLTKKQEKQKHESEV